MPFDRAAQVYYNQRKQDYKKACQRFHRPSCTQLASRKFASPWTGGTIRLQEPVKENVMIIIYAKNILRKTLK